jgi:hypothetical protein
MKIIFENVIKNWGYNLNWSINKFLGISEEKVEKLRKSSKYI